MNSLPFRYFLALTILMFSMVLHLNGVDLKPNKDGIQLKRVEGHIKSGNAMIRYFVEDGQGIPCLMIGMIDRDLKYFAPKLKQHLLFIHMDVRGLLQSDSPLDVSKITLDTLMDDMDAVRKALNLKEMAVMGHSIHGTVAIEYARKFLKNASHIIAIGSPPIYGERYSKVRDMFWQD